ncbi:hypothetical protein ACS0TY_007018 [Phlomoides rotata]
MKGDVHKDHVMEFCLGRDLYALRQKQPENLHDPTFITLRKTEVKPLTNELETMILVSRSLIEAQLLFTVSLSSLAS